MKKSRTAALAAAPVALVIALAGCSTADDGGPGMPGMNHGGGAPTSSSARGQAEFNVADSMFVMMMIPHHEQGIEMSDIILGKADVDESILDLAQQIKDAQGPEIELMESWLDGWGMPSSGGMGEMGHGDGMMSEDDMAALEAAEGTEAARLFLEQMIEHHEGAIEMAEEELDDGASPEVLALAERIVTSQTAEIATMSELLAQL
ncbi:DUF305 domain-containing protein [Microbacterium sp. SLBN-146]|uniref:DUF305 domain-containing protein n=1 Tax=Microbacterium sp. SLBN-146 TaxID=2768457 RepID=UPI00115003B8|nr:DUF305 domain-containing protein [Microbacterium sp. SLBN-146]TQJ31338.1 uncharacterized protein (DUF305 family) [Microbacterium sp. SLBN-146]